MKNLIPTRDLYNNLPQLPLSERDRRWKTARAWMRKQDVDCLLVVGNDMTFGLGMGNFRYLSGCAPRHGGFLIFPLNEDPIIIAEQYHMYRPYHPCLMAHDWVKEAYPNVTVDDMLNILQERISPLKKLGLVSGANTVQYQNMPYDVFQRIHQRLQDVEIIDASKLLFDMRAIKSDVELDFLRKAGQIHRKVLQAKIDTTAEGVRENEVFAAMMSTMLVNGAESQGFNLLHSGAVNGPYLEHMLHGLDADMCPTTRVLQKGDAIISESHVSYGGYMSAAEFTVCVGQPPKEYERLFYIGVECMNAAMEKLKPGYTFGDAIDAEIAIVKKYGIDMLELGFHGHGIGSPEPPKAIRMGMDQSVIPPRWQLDHTTLDVEFQKNMVVGTNIDLFDPNWRTDVGIMFGDCVVIGEKPELLVNTPQELIVK